MFNKFLTYTIHKRMHLYVKKKPRDSFATFTEVLCDKKKFARVKPMLPSESRSSTQSWTRSWNELFFEVFNKSENCPKFGLLKIPVASSRIHMMKFPSGIMYLFAALGYLGSCVFKVECMQ